MGKAEDNKRQKKEALLNTALELFGQKGIQNTAISDIVQKAGVAKGTFYLYFKDKYDIRDKLIVHLTSKLFSDAVKDMRKLNIQDIPEQIIFVVDYIIEVLKKDKIMLKLIAKNLSWGIYKKVLGQRPESESDETEPSYYHSMLQSAKEQNRHFDNLDVTLFLIIELVGSSIYSAILYEEPVGIEELKPYLFSNIRIMLENAQKQENIDKV